MIGACSGFVSHRISKAGSVDQREARTRRPRLPERKSPAALRHGRACSSLIRLWGPRRADGPTIVIRLGLQAAYNPSTTVADA